MHNSASKESIETLISQHPLIVLVKKESKALLKSLKEQSIDNLNKTNLMSCQNKIAKEKGYLDWYTFYNSIKIDIEKNYHVLPKLNLLDEILLEGIHNNCSTIIFEYINNKFNIILKTKNTMKKSFITKDIPFSSNIDIDSKLLLSLLSDFNIKLDKSNNSKHNREYSITIYNSPFNVMVKGSHKIYNQEYKFNFQFLPIYPDGCAFIINYGDFPNKENYSAYPLEKLGFTKQQANSLIELYSRKKGMSIIGGQTGSGSRKTTTTILNIIGSYENFKSYYFHSQYDVESLEEEYYSDHILNEESHNFISQVGRVNPDIIVFPHMRDRITVANLMTQVEAGIKVFTTANAFSATHILERLADFNLNVEEVTSNKINTLMYQKLLPVVCPHCSQYASKSKDIKVIEAFSYLKKNYPLVSLKNVKIRSKNGCSHCNEYGVTGRTVCTEIIDYQHLLKYYKLEIIAILNQPDYVEHNQIKKFTMITNLWRKFSDNNILSDNMIGKTCIEHAIKKVIEGKISLLDIEYSFLAIKYINN